MNPEQIINLQERLELIRFAELRQEFSSGGVDLVLDRLFRPPQLRQLDRVGDFRRIIQQYPLRLELRCDALPVCIVLKVGQLAEAAELLFQLPALLRDSHGQKLHGKGVFQVVQPAEAVLFFQEHRNGARRDVSGGSPARPAYEHKPVPIYGDSPFLPVGVSERHVRGVG